MLAGLSDLPTLSAAWYRPEPVRLALASSPSMPMRPMALAPLAPRRTSNGVMPSNAVRMEMSVTLPNSQEAGDDVSSTTSLNQLVRPLIGVFDRTAACALKRLTTSVGMRTHLPRPDSSDAADQ